VSKPAYVVKEVEKSLATPETPIGEWPVVQAWEITRIENGFGWHIGTWTEKIAADTVARLLNGLAEHEVGG
jgi:hypothetical protein